MPFSCLPVTHYHGDWRMRPHITDTADAPWVVIKSDDKKRARLNCMQHFLANLDYADKNEHVVHGPDPMIVGTPSQVIEKDRHLRG